MRFNKRIKIAPGVKLNIGKGGISTSVGVRGASVNVGKKGAYLNTSLPGTGLSNRTKISGRNKQKTQNEHHDSASSVGAKFLMLLGVAAITFVIVTLVL